VADIVRISVPDVTRRLTGTFRPGRPSHSDEAFRHTGRKNMLPKGAGLRTLPTTRSAPPFAEAEMLANEIAKRTRQYVYYTMYDDVEGSVHHGVVTLTGKVTMPYKASDIGDLVARVPGVREVDNEISTLPVSMFDDQLRVAIASQIYRDPLFWNYAIEVNPPIHVVVEHGHVTLTGVVNSEVERRKAETVARMTSGVFSVDNKLRLDREMRSTQ
jgi:osmotically-inducible protein OsmY